MTSLWGPLGWMTLHSVSMVYPEIPSQTDKQILLRFMNLFRDSITCPNCHQHFKVIFQNYTISNPEWNSSRFNFFLFVCRAHNTVNRRLNKPKPASVKECLDMYRQNTKINSGAFYRQKYIEYLSRNWGAGMGGDGLIHIGEVRELRKINDEYWNRLTDDSIATFVMNADVLAFIEETPQTRPFMSASGIFSSIPNNQVHVGLKRGRFRLS